MHKIKYCSAIYKNILYFNNGIEAIKLWKKRAESEEEACERIIYTLVVVEDQ